MKIKKLLVFFSLLSNSILYAQPIKWAQKIGGTGSDFARNMETDNRGNTFIIGGFNGTVVLPGTGTTSARTLTSFGQTDMFLTKMVWNRNMVWKNSIGSSGHECGDYYYWGIKYDNKSNLYLTGTFSGSATFTTTSGSSQTITSNGGYDSFVSQKLIVDTIPSLWVRSHFINMFNQVVFDNKDTRDYQWSYALLSNYGLSVMPLKVWLLILDLILMRLIQKT